MSPARSASSRSSSGTSQCSDWQSLRQYEESQRVTVSPQPRSRIVHPVAPRGESTANEKPASKRDLRRVPRWRDDVSGVTPASAAQKGEHATAIDDVRARKARNGGAAPAHQRLRGQRATRTPRGGGSPPPLPPETLSVAVPAVTVQVTPAPEQLESRCSSETSPCPAP